MTLSDWYQDTKTTLKEVIFPSNHSQSIICSFVLSDNIHTTTIFTRYQKITNAMRYIFLNPQFFCVSPASRSHRSKNIFKMEDTYFLQNFLKHDTIRLLTFFKTLYG